MMIRDIKEGDWEAIWNSNTKERSILLKYDLFTQCSITYL